MRTTLFPFIACSTCVRMLTISMSVRLHHDADVDPARVVAVEGEGAVEVVVEVRAVEVAWGCRAGFAGRGTTRTVPTSVVFSLSGPPRDKSLGASRKTWSRHATNGIHATAMTRTVRAIDPAALPKHFDAPAAEARWAESWDRVGIYAYDPGRPREDTFVVDTPPPTVSGSLHVGHVFSYTHADVLVRHRRMRGESVFYPIGWDDNGLPTERRVQNLFHVRSDARLPYEPGLALEPASGARLKEPPRIISRQNFI